MQYENICMLTCKTQAMDLSLRYSFGGTREEPLVARCVRFIVDEDPATMAESKLQEYLLERTDLLLADLCSVFDTAMDVCVASSYTDMDQVDIMMGACAYTVKNILSQAISSKYVLMFTRVQQLLNIRSQLVRTLGEDSVDVVSGFILPHWEALKRMDATFATPSALLLQQNEAVMDMNLE
jgi:hypothetical protein